jgi:hypothetical protein
MNPIVVAGLIKRRATLAGDIEAAHESLRKMIRDLENLDATIQQFDPTYQVESIRPKAFRPPKDWAIHTTTQRCRSDERSAQQPSRRR